MKRPHLALALAGLVAAGCSAGSTSRDINQNWSARSVMPRVTRYFTGYDASKDGTYRDFAWRRKQEMSLTMSRHFLNYNPDNPNQPEDPSRYQPRPNNSLLPNPWYYIHWEGLIMGLVIAGASGTYFPLPVDSLLGTLEPGGVKEFADGFEEFFTPVGVVTVSLVHTWISPAFQGITRGDAPSSYARIVTIED